MKKAEMHSRNPHNQGYNFEELQASFPPLQQHIVRKPDGKQTIDFSQPAAVKALNAALLSVYYKVHFWDIPEGYLCPAVPGRADYIHYIADLLADLKHSNKKLTGLDVGTGANVIYPIIATQSYPWKMIASDINGPSMKSAKAIVDSNSNLKGKIELRLQRDQGIFTGIIKDGEKLNFTLCNPPFHASADAAMAGSRKKNKNLARHKDKRKSGSTKNSSAHNKNLLNFGGQHNELWCDGGEFAFIKQMIEESVLFQNQVDWFTCLVSKKDNVKKLIDVIEKCDAKEHKIVQMAQGAKASRFIAWRFN